MLSSDQMADLAAAICATAETLGQTVSASAAELMAEDLAEYPMQDIGKALRACRKELTGKLTLAAIIRRVQASDGRPGRDEAWSIALAGSDEFDTVVMTEEIQKAMSASAPILELGDKVGARMAFMSAYDRHVDEARRNNAPANWTVSLGFDPDRRKVAIDNAVRTGLLPAPEAQKEIMRLGLDSPITEDGRAIAGLLTGTVAKPSPDLRGKLDDLRKSMQETRRANAAAKQAEEAKRQADQERRREEQVAAANELLAKRATA